MGNSPSNSGKRWIHLWVKNPVARKNAIYQGKCSDYPGDKLWGKSVGVSPLACRPWRKTYLTPTYSAETTVTVTVALTPSWRPISTR